MKTQIGKHVYSLALIALFTALIIVGAFIRIPVPMVPFTLQTMFTALAGIFLGSKRGTISVLVYLFMGLIGIPVFTQGGGISYVFQPTFGYLIGFVFGTFAVGRIVETSPTKVPSFARLAVAGAVNIVIVYLFGVVYWYCIGNFVIASPVGVWMVILHGALLCLPGDVVSYIVCAIAARRAVPFVKRGFTYVPTEQA